MEMSGVVRYEGEKFGSPVGESDGIPDLEGGNTGWAVCLSVILDDDGGSHH